jgi:hypothetical protein
MNHFKVNDAPSNVEILFGFHACSFNHDDPGCETQEWFTTGVEHIANSDNINTRYEKIFVSFFGAYIHKSFCR